LLEWQGKDETRDHERTKERAAKHLDKLRELFGCVLMALALGFSGASRADVPKDQLPEVEHLLAYLETSECEMVRNGRSHNGEEAVKHVRRKYEYYRDDISSTEDFIRLSASRSTMSGKPYQVHCPGQPAMNSQDWLLTELSVFRGKL
jgi:hypothetical protein